MTTGQSTIHNDPSRAWTAKAAPEGETGEKNGYVVQGPSSGGRPSAIFYPKAKKGSPHKGATPAP